MIDMNYKENLCVNPYDSEWEKDFEWVLFKNLARGMTLKNQVPLAGRFRADFVIEDNHTGEKYVFEFDGKAYHDAGRDEWRDSLIFEKEPSVVSILRVDAKTGHSYHESTRAFIAKTIPKCFDYYPSDPHQLNWEKRGCIYTASVFDERADGDVWWDSEMGRYRDGAPIAHLKITYKTRPEK